MNQPTDLEALARELRQAAKTTKHVDRDWTGLMTRAADALEAKWAAERQLLARLFYAVSCDLGSILPDWDTEPAETHAHWSDLVDRAFASGVILRAPTAREIARALQLALGYTPDEADVPSDSFYHQADAVLALLSPQKAVAVMEPKEAGQGG